MIVTFKFVEFYNIAYILYLNFGSFNNLYYYI